LRREEARLAAQLQATARLHDLEVDKVGERKQKPKRVELRRGPPSDPDSWWPARAILNKIEQGVYAFDLWHLAQEGSEASRRTSDRGAARRLASSPPLHVGRQRKGGQQGVPVRPRGGRQVVVDKAPSFPSSRRPAPLSIHTTTAHHNGSSIR